MSRTVPRSIIVFNGAAKGVNINAPMHLPSFGYTIMTNVPEMELTELKKEHKVSAYYFYDSDGSDSEPILNINLPTMHLYDAFINTANRS